MDFSGSDVGSFEESSDSSSSLTDSFNKSGKLGDPAVLSMREFLLSADSSTDAFRLTALFPLFCFFDFLPFSFLEGVLFMGDGVIDAFVFLALPFRPVALLLAISMIIIELD